jgi:hypothetical protein
MWITGQNLIEGNIYLVWKHILWTLYKRNDPLAINLLSKPINCILKTFITDVCEMLRFPNDRKTGISPSEIQTFFLRFY